MNRLMTFGQDQRWRRLAAQRLRSQPGDLVLDLGAGTGDLSLAVLQAGASCLRHQRGLQPMLAGARGRGSKQLVMADALTLPFTAGHFDALVSGFLVSNVSDLDRALEEMKRVLKPGGRLVVLDTTRPRRNLLLPFIRFYLRVIIPLLGTLVTGDREAYRYLPSSTRAFYPPKSWQRDCAEPGSIEVDYQRLMFGTAALHWGRKN